MNSDSKTTDELLNEELTRIQTIRRRQRKVARIGLIIIVIVIIIIAIELIVLKSKIPY